MSQYGLIYRLEFKNVEGLTVRVNISPTDVLIPDVDTPVVIDLQGSGQPLVISASNNDEDKYTPIRSKSAKITICTDSANGIDSSTFSQGSDSLWKVSAYVMDTPVDLFTGYLIMADNQQPFQPDPQYLTLTATDHLAALKEVAWVDFSDINPIGKYKVAEIIAMCLRKTGLNLNINVVNNLRAGGGEFEMFATITGGNTITVPNTKMFYVGQRLEITTTAGVGSVFVLTVTSTVITIDGLLVNVVDPAAVFLDYNSQFHWYDVVYLDAKTFEKEIGLSVSCYDVLSKILGEDCYITQWKSEWWIFRVDEFEVGSIYVSLFNYLGVYQSQSTTAWDWIIGDGQASQFANADTLLRFVRPHGFVKETFNYNVPLEVPCNVDFSRGDVIDDTFPEKTYALDCWDLLEGVPGYYGTVDGTTATIHRVFNPNNQEDERYIVLTPRTTFESSSINDATYVQSEAIPINQYDKFELSCSYKLSFNTAGTASERLMRVVLNGDDGSWYILGEATTGSGIPIWYNTALWTAFSAKGPVDVDFTSTDWNSISWVAPPAPVKGKLYVWLNQLNQNSAAYDSHDIWYSNLRFDYFPLINGSYQKYSGQYDQVTRLLTGYMANRDNEVFISDSPAPLYKGSMYLLVDGAYILFPIWYSAAQWALGYPTDTDYLQSYGYIQSYSVWNQYKGYNEITYGRGVGINIFSGSVYGLTVNWPDLIHKYTLSDPNTQTDNRYFMCLSLSQDWRTCIWTGVFIEVYNTVIGKTFNDTHEFKYISG